MSKARELAELGAVYDSGALSNRNVVINGGMQCWQRATAATAADSTYNTVDRFRAYKNVGAYTTERSDDHPTGAGFSLKAQCTTADTSLSASEYVFINHEVEGQNLQHFEYGTSTAKNVTLSFWVKSSKTGIYTVGVYKHAGSATGYMYRREYTINAANTWEKKEFTISPTAGSTTFITNSGGSITNSNGNGFGISFNLAMGSNFHGANDTWETGAKYATSNQVNWVDSTSNNFYLAQVQMEVGSEATPFEHLSYGDELARCRRYTFVHQTNVAYAWGAISGYSNTTTNALTFYQYPVEMRATPSLSTSGGFQLADGHSVYSVSSMSAGTLSPITARVDVAASGLTVGRVAMIRNDNDADAKITFDAEL